MSFRNEQFATHGSSFGPAVRCPDESRRELRAAQTGETEMRTLGPSARTPTILSGIQIQSHSNIVARMTIRRVKVGEETPQ